MKKLILLVVAMLTAVSTYAKPECKVVPLKDHVIQKNEKYFVHHVAYLRKRLGPAKFDTMGFLPDLKKLEKSFSLKAPFTIKDIVSGKLASPFPDIPTVTFYQITDEYWVDKDGLYRDMTGCPYEDVLKAGEGVNFSIKKDVKLVDNSGEWIEPKTILFCKLKEQDQVHCYSKAKFTILSLNDVKTKLLPVTK